MHSNTNHTQGIKLLLVAFILLYAPFVACTLQPDGALQARVSTNNPDDDTCEAINCEEGFYQTIDNDGKLVRYEYDGFALGFTQIATFGFTVNATAFNIEDNYLYTIARDDRRLIRFDSDGNWTSLGILSLPANVQIGSFDNDGNYYVCLSLIHI